MRKLVFSFCNEIQYEAIQQILLADKFTVIVSNPEEGVTTEINSDLTNEEKFNLHRKYRKKYFKMRNKNE